MEKSCNPSSLGPTRCRTKSLWLESSLPAPSSQPVNATCLSKETGHSKVHDTKHAHKINLFQLKVFKKRKQLQELAQPAPGGLLEEVSSRQETGALLWAGACQMPLCISQPGDTRHITGLFLWNTLPSLQYKRSCFQSHSTKRSSAMAIVFTSCSLLLELSKAPEVKVH